ncbi:hypothetical protein C8Q80DRAFT_1111364, partial [Daedaleopsis nitida]
FFTQTQQFMDAYQKGLSGKQAAWASKKDRGHRMLLDAILWRSLMQRMSQEMDCILDQ